jgi:hypothetical protein
LADIATPNPLRSRGPAVTLHFNSDSEGGDVVIVPGAASVAYDRSPSGLRPYLDNYETSITEVLGTPTTPRPDRHGGRGAPGSR